MKTLLFLFSLAFSTFVNATTYYTIDGGNFDDNNSWSTSSGGAACGCFPSASDDIVIESGFIIFIDDNYAATNVTVNSGGVLEFKNGNDRTFTVSGNLTVNGSLIGGDELTAKVVLTGTSTTISGNGSIYTFGGVEITTGNKTISSGSNLFCKTIAIIGAITVTNNGNLSTIQGYDITGSVAGSTITNGTNSSLNCGGALLATGTLNASASGNVVKYYSSLAQSIKTPTSNTYYHLLANVASTKTIAAALTIDGNLQIIDATVDAAGFALTIKGDFTNRGTFTSNSNLVSFTGTSNQTIINLDGSAFYNLTVNKSSGTLYLEDDVSVSNQLTMTSGNINAGTDVLTIGTSTVYCGSLSHTSGLVIGAMSRWIPTSNTGSDINFPIGNSGGTSLELILNATTIATGGSLLVQFSTNNPGNDGFTINDGGTTLYNPFVEGFWSCTAQNSLSITNYDLDLSTKNFTSFTPNSTTRIVQREHADSNWVADGSHSNWGSDVAHRTGLTNDFYSDFTLADITNCTAPSTSSITGSTSVCASVTGEAYSVTNTGGSTYTWTIVGGTKASGGTTNSITVDWGATGIAGSISVVEDNGCASGFPSDLNVSVHSVPVTSISGDTSIHEYRTDEPYSCTNTAGYTYTWTITGGTLDGGQGTNSITVDWGAPGTGTISVVANNTGCSNSSAAYDQSINIYELIDSRKSGNWLDTETWECRCIPLLFENPRIMSGHTVKVDGVEIIENLTIQAGGELENDGGGRTLTINADLEVNGTIKGDVGVTFAGISTNLSGQGFIETNGNFTFSSGDKTIVAGTSLRRKNGPTNITALVNVVNYGSYTTETDIVGSSATSTWTNEINSYLGTEAVILSTGRLVASATGNTVEYMDNNDQNVKTPVSSTYYNLIASDDKNKILGADLIVAGDLTMNDQAVFDIVNLSDYSLTVGGDWENNATDPFIPRNGTVTFNGSAEQKIKGTTTTNFYDMVINNSDSSVVVVTGFNLENNLTFTDGCLDLNGQTVALGTTGSFSGESNASRAFGATGQITATRTLSNTATTYTNIAGLGLDLVTTTALPGVTNFTRTHGVKTNVTTESEESFKRQFNISPANNTSLNITMRLYFFAGELNGLKSNSAVKMYRAVTPFTTWAERTNSTWVDAAIDYVEETGISQFSMWTPSNSNVALPIELLSFYAEDGGIGTNIYWETSTEINNKDFKILKSTDYTDYQLIHTTPGAGNSQAHLTYHFLDREPVEGLYYYKLIQTDFDGKTTEYGPISFFTNQDRQSDVFPNPASPSQKVSIINEFFKSGSFEFGLYNMQGKLISELYNQNQGNNELVQLPLPANVPPGVYTLEAKRHSDGLKVVQSLVIR